MIAKFRSKEKIIIDSSTPDHKIYVYAVLDYDLFDGKYLKFSGYYFCNSEKSETKLERIDSKLVKSQCDALSEDILKGFEGTHWEAHQYLIEQGGIKVMYEQEILGQTGIEFVLYEV